ncbi:lipopolysaccharide assembly protein LapB [Pseudonocardia sp. EC080619-01]|uniref:tetratricopeptide repeat protein n=1 Tax=Pseudonocardia sp. EC080619-01 TaxID=1096856 RepID=UPI0009E90657|nr:hypothetical protein [Pseudonocardia sp. EC080619-01]
MTDVRADDGADVSRGPEPGTRDDHVADDVPPARDRAERPARGPRDERRGDDRRGDDRRGDDRRGDDRPRGRRDDRSGDRRDRPGAGRDGRQERRRVIPESAERTFVAEPDLPASITPSDLDGSVRRDLRGLQKETAESVARHLVAAGVLVDEDPERALEHARYARRRASRIAVVREAAGIVAYHAGEWNEALGEFRAARRMGGGPGHVHVMADIERALGRPERAIDLARSPEARDLGAEERIELLIVAAGARRDLGEVDAAVVGLQVPELDAARRDPWSARLFYAYADNLLAAGRESESVQWFVHAHDADIDGQTDAAARIAELTGDELPGVDDDGMTIGWEDVPVDEVVEEPGAEDAGVEDATVPAPEAVSEPAAQVGDTAEVGDTADVGDTAEADDTAEVGVAAEAEDSPEAGDAPGIGDGPGIGDNPEGGDDHAVDGTSDADEHDRPSDGTEADRP